MYYFSLVVSRHYFTSSFSQSKKKICTSSLICKHVSILEVLHTYDIVGISGLPVKIVSSLFTYFEYWWDELERRGIRRSWEAKHLIDSVSKLSDRLPDYWPGKAGLTDGTLTAALCPNTILSLHSSNLHSSSLITPTCQFVSHLSPLHPPDLVFSEFREIYFFDARLSFSLIILAWVRLSRTLQCSVHVWMQ